MEIWRYLATTAAEAETADLPPGFGMAYMACHFSPYGTGLSNIPQTLPEGSMLILNDRTPIRGHDGLHILNQLEKARQQLGFGSLLLDFQRPDNPETASLCRILTGQLSCPVGIAQGYALEGEGAVFLAPPPLDQPLAAYLAPWHGRELWLDIAPQCQCITVTESGSASELLPFSSPPEDAFTDEGLHCRYRAEVLESEIRFTLWRDLPLAEKLLREGKVLGIRKAIGLYQEYFCLGSR